MAANFITSGTIPANLTGAQASAGVVGADGIKRYYATDRFAASGVSTFLADNTATWSFASVSGNAVTLTNAANQVTTAGTYVAINKTIIWNGASTQLLAGWNGSAYVNGVHFYFVNCVLDFTNANGGGTLFILGNSNDAGSGANRGRNVGISQGSANTSTINLYGCRLDFGTNSGNYFYQPSDLIGTDVVYDPNSAPTYALSTAYNGRMIDTQVIYNAGRGAGGNWNPYGAYANFSGNTFYNNLFRVGNGPAGNVEVSGPQLFVGAQFPYISQTSYFDANSVVSTASFNNVAQWVGYNSPGTTSASIFGATLTGTGGFVTWGGGAGQWSRASHGAVYYRPLNYTFADFSATPVRNVRLRASSNATVNPSGTSFIARLPNTAPTAGLNVVNDALSDSDGLPASSRYSTDGGTSFSTGYWDWGRAQGVSTTGSTTMFQTTAGATDTSVPYALPTTIARMSAQNSSFVGNTMSRAEWRSFTHDIAGVDTFDASTQTARTYYGNIGSGLQVGAQNSTVSQAAVNAMNATSDGNIDAYFANTLGAPTTSTLPTPQSGSSWGKPVAGGAGQWLVVSGGTTNRAAYTADDGTTWSLVTLTSSQTWNTPVWNGSYWLITPLSFSSTANRYDGTTVSAVTLTSSQTWNTPVWNGSYWLIAPFVGNRLSRYDGTTVSSVTLTEPLELNLPVWNGSYWLIVPTQGSSTANRYDGTTVSAVALTDSPEWWPPVWNGSYWLIVAGNGITNRYDGTTVSSVTLSTLQSSRQPVWNGSYWLVMPLSTSSVANRYDGTTASSVTLSTSQLWGVPVWNDSYWILGPSSATTSSVANRYDGTIISSVALTSSESWNLPVWNGTYWFLTTSSVSSTANRYDGTAVSSVTLTASQRWQEPVWNGSHWFFTPATADSTTANTLTDISDATKCYEFNRYQWFNYANGVSAPDLASGILTIPQPINYLGTGFSYNGTSWTFPSSPIATDITRINSLGAVVISGLANPVIATIVIGGDTIALPGNTTVFQNLDATTSISGFNTSGVIASGCTLGFGTASVLTLNGNASFNDVNMSGNCNITADISGRLLTLNNCGNLTASFPFTNTQGAARPITLVAAGNTILPNTLPAGFNESYTVTLAGDGDIAGGSAIFVDSAGIADSVAMVPAGGYTASSTRQFIRVIWGKSGFNHVVVNVVGGNTITFTPTSSGIIGSNPFPSWQSAFIGGANQIGVQTGTLASPTTSADTYARLEFLKGGSTATGQTGIPMLQALNAAITSGFSVSQFYSVISGVPTLGTNSIIFVSYNNSAPAAGTQRYITGIGLSGANISLPSADLSNSIGNPQVVNLPDRTATISQVIDAVEGVVNDSDNLIYQGEIKLARGVNRASLGIPWTPNL